MNDFLKGYSQGMTGSTNGLPSQSVLEAMGRDAARNQWNNNNAPRHGGSSSAGRGSQGESIPVTTLLYEAGKKMRIKKLARDLAIGFVLSFVSILLDSILPKPMMFVTIIAAIAGWLMTAWALLRLPVYLIAKIGTLLGKK